MEEKNQQLGTNQPEQKLTADKILGPTRPNNQKRMWTSIARKPEKYKFHFNPSIYHEIEEGLKVVLGKRILTDNCITSDNIVGDSKDFCKSHIPSQIAEVFVNKAKMYEKKKMKLIYKFNNPLKMIRYLKSFIYKKIEDVNISEYNTVFDKETFSDLLADMIISQLYVCNKPEMIQRMFKTVNNSAGVIHWHEKDFAFYRKNPELLATLFCIITLSVKNFQKTEFLKRSANNHISSVIKTR